MTAVFPGITQESLEEIDTNNDNRVSRTELYANDAQQRKRRRPHMTAHSDAATTAMARRAGVM